MITKKLKTKSLSLATFAIIFALVFSQHLVSVNAQTLETQNYYTTPDGPPPGNNAPAPIHEGTTGQGKYWNSVPSNSLGSLFNLVEGLLADWVIADTQGVAATQFCLGSETAINDAFPGSTEGLNCVTADSGWTTGGAGGGGGAGSPTSLTNGVYNGNALVWRADTNSWTSSPHFRQVSFTGSSAFLSFVMGDWPDTIFSTIFGIPDLAVGQAFGKFALNGSFYYRPDTSSDLMGEDGGTTQKLLAGHPTENYRVSWRTPAEMGLATQQDITNLAGTITNISSLPDAEQNGQFLFWNTDFDEGFWDLTNSIFASGNLLNLIGASLVIGTDSDFRFKNNDNCPSESNGSVVYAKQQSLYGMLIENSFDIKCSLALKLKDVYGDDGEEIVVKNIPILENDEYQNTNVRGLCYTTSEFESIEEGTLIDCQVLANGNIYFLGPKYTTTQYGGITDELEEVVTSGITTGVVDDYSDTSGNVFTAARYSWDVPFGVTEIQVSGCAGGGGGGGGAAGQPDTSDRPGGGGGGGGEAGQCETEIVEVTGFDRLVFTVGAGGKRGLRGMRYAVPNGTYQNQCRTCSIKTHGSPGGRTIVQKYNGTTLVGEVMNLEPGTGGSGGYTRSDGASLSQYTNSGGFGGKGGATPTGSIDLDDAEIYGDHNGYTGKDADINEIGDIFSILNYVTLFASDSSAGGRGGRGEIMTEVLPPSLNVYSIGSSPSSPGDGASANTNSQGNASNLYGGMGGLGGWASGGGGGGGASGYDWADTCAFPAPQSQSMYNNGSDNCAGSNEGSTSSTYWFSRGGYGGHGGPGFVKISW